MEEGTNVTRAVHIAAGSIMQQSVDKKMCTRKHKHLLHGAVSIHSYVCKCTLKRLKAGLKARFSVSSRNSLKTPISSIPASSRP